MIKEEFEKIVAKLEVTDMENYLAKDPLIEKEIDLFSKDIQETISFLKNDCTGRQFVWMSEVFDEIVEKTNSREFIEVLKETVKKFPNENKEFYLDSSIQSAEEYLK